VVSTKHGVVVTATWRHQPSVIKRALGVRKLPILTRAAAPAPRVRAAIVSHAKRAKGSVASVPGAVYTGLGFDACSTPSTSQMSAWSASPYRAVGVYIGGTNMACSQDNLTSTWVSTQSAAGWHLIPIYVGLQAPSNGCGCASMSSSSAAAQGTAAAHDAVSKAEAIGLSAGNPIYTDMEGYDTTSSNTTAVMAFLQAWTNQLHASGYKSGVYSSASSGIRDLASRWGSAYKEPDDIWIANWNGAKNTTDANAPSADWASHQRLHQYQGDHNESYGGDTINIDGDYVDGATAATGTVSTFVAVAPSLSVSPEAGGAIDLRPSWSGASGVSDWRVLAGATPTTLSAVTNPVSVGAASPIVVKSAYDYFEVVGLGSTGQTLGTSPIVATPAHLAIAGQSAFVPAQGLGGLPVGCFKAMTCSVVTTISVGKKTIAKTGRENIGVGGGIAYFKLTAAGRKLLTHALHHRLAVKAAVRERSGFGVTRQLNLIPYTTTGKSTRRSIHQSQPLRIVGTSEFVSNGWSGGILAVCAAGVPCRSSVKISAGRTTVASTKPELLGAGELGYLSFKLTPAGHRLLLKQRTNQLATKLTISTAGQKTTSAVNAPAATSTNGGSGLTGGASNPGAPVAPVTTAPATATAQIALSLFH
jgi:hypothetical protein